MLRAQRSRREFTRCDCEPQLLVGQRLRLRLRGVGGGFGAQRGESAHAVLRALVEARVQPVRHGTQQRRAVDAHAEGHRVLQSRAQSAAREQAAANRPEQRGQCERQCGHSV